MSDTFMHIDKKAIGRRLSAIRKTRNMTQTAISAAVGIGIKSWNTYEGGRTPPPPDVLGRLWQLTGCTSDYILFGHTAGMPMDLVLAVRELLPLDGIDRDVG